MKNTRFMVIVLATLVAGCSKPETPQQVAAEFWQAMAEQDASDVASLSTLASASEFDGYQRDWLDVVPDFGRVVIEAGEATIVTRLPAENATGGERREILTHLVQLNERWLVEYQRTGNAVQNPSVMDGLRSQISILSDRVGQALGRSSEDIGRQMDEMARDLEIYSEEAERRAKGAMKDFGDSLNGLMKELEQSIDKALKENQQAPESERAGLQQAAYDLNQGRENLDEPDFEVLADASRSLSQAASRLVSLSSETFEPYQAEWRSTLEEARERAQVFFEDLKNSL